MKRIDVENRRGSVTVEASIILVIFISAYIAMMSIINIYRAYSLIQNAVNQTAKQVSEYTYIAKKLGIHNIGQTASEDAADFTDKTEKMINTIQVFFNASANGLENATDVAENILNNDTNQYPSDILDQMSSVGADAQSIYDAGEAMTTSVTDYFSDEKAIFKGILSVLKDGAYDAVKMAVAMPISRSLTNKYLSAYPDDHLEKLGVQGGKSGLNYWGSSFFLDMQSIEVSATYKMRIQAPFLDRFDFVLRNTASTRAWIGDGTFNEPNEAGGSGSGAPVEDGADEQPGRVDDFDDNKLPPIEPDVLNIPASVWIEKPDERGKKISNWNGTPIKRNLTEDYNDISIFNEEERYIGRVHSMDTRLNIYEDGRKFLGEIKRDMKKLSNFDSQGDVTTDRYDKKYYYLVLRNEELNAEQKQAIAKAAEYARENGIEMKVYKTN